MVVICLDWSGTGDVCVLGDVVCLFMCRSLQFISADGFWGLGFVCRYIACRIA